MTVNITKSGLTTGWAAGSRGISSSTAAVGRLERLPKWLNLIPMVIQWLWLSLLYRSFALPSAANPSITAGGMVGEGKLEYFAIMGPHARSLTAAYAPIVNRGVPSLAEIEKHMARLGLSYPVILKPDIGWCGFGVRLVRDREEAAGYLSRYPLGEQIVLQRFLPESGEAGLYYVRHPDAQRGCLRGILLRYFPQVIGDGRRTVAELIEAAPRLKRLGRDGHSDPWRVTDFVPQPGEVVRLSTIGSTRVGGLYRDATAEVTPALSEAIDAVARDMKDLHIARFDVRFDSMAALLDGKGFTIIEVNGAGSEAVHAWDPRYSLSEAYAIVFAKQREIFAIGDAMRRRGHRPISAARLAQLHLRQQRLIGLYPPSN